MKKHAAPIIAAILLLLPVLYVGSYLALVRPRGVSTGIHIFSGRAVELFSTSRQYVVFDAQAKRFFWPLEQIDRKVRPGAWPNSWEADFEEAVRDIRAGS